MSIKETFFGSFNKQAVERRQLQAKYRQVFGTGYGPEVLTDILSECHFAEDADPENPSQIGAQNLGLKILYKIGTFSSGNRLDVTMALLGVVPKEDNSEDMEEVV